MAETLAAKSELDIFTDAPTQVAITEGQYVDFFPINSYRDNVTSPIEFHIVGNADEYLDCDDIHLLIELKMLTKDGEPIRRAGENPLPNVGPVNLPATSIFSDCEVILGNTQIEGGSHNYAYKSYLQTLLEFEPDTKKTQLVIAGWDPDPATNQIDDPTQNASVRSRADALLNGATCQYVTKLHVDFFRQSRYVLPLTDVRIRWLRQRADWYMMSAYADHEIYLYVQKAVLYARRVRVLPSVQKAHADGLLHYNAVYPYNKVEVTSFTIGQGAQSIVKEDVFSGRVPKLCIFGMVRNDAYNGSRQLSPFNFQHFNVNYVSIFVGSEEMPHRAFHPDFANGNVAREFAALYQAFNLFGRDKGIIKPEDFRNGNTLFAFNLSPDQSLVGHRQGNKGGQVRIELKFAQALARTINVVVISVHEAKIEITKSGDVIML